MRDMFGEFDMLVGADEASTERFRCRCLQWIEPSEGFEVILLCLNVGDELDV